MNSESLTIGIDIGGTFTDIVGMNSGGRSYIAKVPSTPHDYSESITAGILQIITAFGSSPAKISRIVHATTVATNTILEGKGALTGLLTTAGFRDVLEMRRLRIPVMYDLQYEKPAPLVPRYLRIEARERMRADGTVKLPLDVESVREAAAVFRDQGVDAVAVCFLHSYANPAHEVEAEQILREELGEAIYICRSADVLPEIREYERTSTTTINAYITPVVKNYLASLQRRLKVMGIDCPIEIMQSAGGIMRFQAAVRKPAYLVESGPAAGVVASSLIARTLGEPNVISFDMGGTTAKAAIIENGEPARTNEYEVGGGINISSKLVQGSGYPIKLQFIDISEIGAGGGSIVAVDRYGQISVGPKSAGAMPGPVCYDLGGVNATLTDALLTLGYINPTAIAGGSFRLNADAGRDAFSSQVADRIAKDPLTAAAGVLTLAVATMTRAVKAVSTYRGRDPREFTLFAFGGNGAVVATEIARALGMQNIIIPQSAGVFSAYGLIYADVEQEASRTVMFRVVNTSEKALETVLAQLAEEALNTLENDGYSRESVILRRQADLRYAGQAYELSVPVRSSGNIQVLVEDFHAEHAKTYGHSAPEADVEIVNLRVTCRIASSASPQSLMPDDNQRIFGERDIYFGEHFGTRRTPIVARNYLRGIVRNGPFVIEDYDSTCVVPPDCDATLDDMGNIRIYFSKVAANEN